MNLCEYPIGCGSNEATKMFTDTFGLCDDCLERLSAEDAMVCFPWCVKGQHAEEIQNLIAADSTIQQLVSDGKIRILPIEQYEERVALTGEYLGTWRTTSRFDWSSPKTTSRAEYSYLAEFMFKIQTLE